MNQELLRSFRNKINDKELILHIFKNRYGRNKWSVICSAMDWIEVSIDEIDVSNLSRKNDNQASIKMITFLSCVDVMWEAVQQLHRVLFDTKGIPFKDDFSVFNQKERDNDFFKTIRACFAAHQINLKKVYPDDKDGELWFASWSGGAFSHKDFSVILYSNNPDKESRFFDVSFSELYEFAEKRYNYLTVLMDRVDEIVEEYLDAFRKIPVKTGDDVISTVELLLEENEQRFDNDYFKYELLKIKRVFEVVESESEQNIIVLDSYKDALEKELEEIKDKLQFMELDELEYQVNDDIPMEIHYPFSKLSDAVWQDEYCLTFDYVFEVIKKYFAGVLEFDESMSQEEVYVLTCAGSYVVNNK